MPLFPAELNILPEEGFTKEKNIFGRKKIGDGLTNILTSVAEPCVVAVDGSWGSGKSIFLKIWAGELRKLEIPVIYFNAFRNDYFDDAFVAIIGEIINQAIKKQAIKPLLLNCKARQSKSLSLSHLQGQKTC